MAGVICQQRIVQTRIQHKSPWRRDVSCGAYRAVVATATYLIIRSVEVLRDGIAALRVRTVVWPFGDRNRGVCHGSLLRREAAFLLRERFYERRKSRCAELSMPGQKEK